MKIMLAVVLGLAAQPALAEVSYSPSIDAAALTLPTDRYGHGVLGDALEWGGMDLSVAACGGCADQASFGVAKTVRVVLPQNRVFEDITARVADLDGNGSAEVLVVETDTNRGASLVVYDASGKRRAATAFMGQPNRWLAPAGIGDFDGDGRIEIAYVDRPHLARELVFVRLQGNRLIEIARAKGFTNHRIGDTTIAGGTRRCAGRDSLIVATADWSAIAEVTLAGGKIAVRATTMRATAANMQRAITCAN